MFISLQTYFKSILLSTLKWGSVGCIFDLLPGVLYSKRSETLLLIVSKAF